MQNWRSHRVLCEVGQVSPVGRLRADIDTVFVVARRSGNPEGLVQEKTEQGRSEMCLQSLDCSPTRS